MHLIMIDLGFNYLIAYWFLFFVFTAWALSLAWALREHRREYLPGSFGKVLGASGEKILPAHRSESWPEACTAQPETLAAKF